jgi:pimeloyl-ACP methyl ester carboxylesterase
MKIGSIKGIVLLLATAAAAAAQNEPPSAIEVPLDRQRPELGKGEVYLELGAPFDPAKPVVLVIADAQQFYVRRGAVAKIQNEIFGPGFNVAGVYGRGTGEEFLAAAAGPTGATDWQKAWGIFESSEWVEDIEALRRALVGPEGKVSLYGQSGGAFLVHQYLAAHGKNVERAITPSALNPILVGELGLVPDRFWQEIGPELHAPLVAALARFPNDRARLVMTLQRQNFFVPAAALAGARSELIRALARGDAKVFEKARKDYQVDQVAEFFESPAGIPIRVRLFEFVAPAGWLERLDPSVVYPDLENQRNFALPLLELWRQGMIAGPNWNKRALHSLEAEVMVLAGVHDHTVDYRSSIALSSLYPHGKLLLFDDDHQFHALAKDGTYHPLIRAFLVGGSASQAFAAALSAADPRRWRD